MRTPRGFRVLFAIVLALGAGGGLYLFLSDDPAARYAYDTIDEPRARPFRGPRTDADRAREQAAGERLARGLEAESGGSTGGGRLLTEAGLGGALDRIGRSGDRLVSLLATRASVDALVVGRDGRLRAVRVTAAGATVDVQGAGPPASVPLPSVADLDAGAPARLARGTGSAPVVSAAITPTGGADVRWSITLEGGRTVSGR